MTTEKSKRVEAKENTEQQEKPEFFIKRKMNSISSGIKDKTRALNEKYVQKSFDKGKEIRKGIEGDIRKLMDRVSERGRKTIDKFPMLGKIEDRAKAEWKKVDEKTRKAMTSLTNRANLPNKTDIERLTEAMETLSRKVDVLAEKQ